MMMVIPPFQQRLAPPSSKHSNSSNKLYSSSSSPTPEPTPEEKHKTQVAMLEASLARHFDNARAISTVASSAVGSGLVGGLSNLELHRLLQARAASRSSAEISQLLSLRDSSSLVAVHHQQQQLAAENLGIMPRLPLHLMGAQQQPQSFAQSLMAVRQQQQSYDLAAAAARARASQAVASARGLELLRSQVSAAASQQSIPRDISCLAALATAASAATIPNRVNSDASALASALASAASSASTRKAPTETEDSSSSGPTVFLDKPGEFDVLCGRGGKSNHHAGNKKYRQVVSEMKARYRTMEAKAAKTDLSRAIVDHVHGYGGRFVKLDKASGRYEVMSTLESRKKTSQALRETKELKWTR